MGSEENGIRSCQGVFLAYWLSNSQIVVAIYNTVDQENNLECGRCDVGKDVIWDVLILGSLRNTGRTS